jgi:hypothetical protein
MKMNIRWIQWKLSWEIGMFLPALHEKFHKKPAKARRSLLELNSIRKKGLKCEKSFETFDRRNMREANDFIQVFTLP